jgi:hypothetical protein
MLDHQALHRVFMTYQQALNQRYLAAKPLPVTQAKLTRGAQHAQPAA